MNKSFKNSTQVTCLFTDEGVTFTDEDREVSFPYGCIDSIKISLMGVLQAVSGSTVCNFAVAHRDRAEMKEMVQFARKAMETAPEAEARTLDLSRGGDVPADLPPEEQLLRYKTMFIQGKISKEEYNARKRQLKKL